MNISHPTASVNYRKHPMGYACVDCGQAGHVGDPVWHSRLCGISPGKAVRPAWPTDEQLVAADLGLAEGIDRATELSEIVCGLRKKSTANVVTILTKPQDGPFEVESFERGRWVPVPGQWHRLRDAESAAKAAIGVWQLSTEFRVIAVSDRDRERRMDHLVARLKQRELRTRGLVCVGGMLRAATDSELDEMWSEGKSRAARRRQVEPAPKPERDLAPRVGMLRTLALEWPGHDLVTITKVKKTRPWAAAVTLEKIGSQIRVTNRAFAEGAVDFEQADKTGGSGVRSVFQLRQGIVYEVFDRARRRGPRRLLMVHDGQCWHDLTPDEGLDAQNRAR